MNELPRERTGAATLAFRVAKLASEDARTPPTPWAAQHALNENGGNNRCAEELVSMLRQAGSNQGIPRPTFDSIAVPNASRWLIAATACSLKTRSL
eukprot:CAMPEP_0119390338 /NCGR_PEP_ID=MMETSP1334-20130426/112947_1 /TAXON_ID=127549 /ORGANISM="Calcidiscus leptoporus, Strain RCC1130" /LENGTH=95 /DNA_ID=CAMNT_0007412797 /DNA_START=92 /DNA_END=377 /DNA_ORIENTATION=+